MLKNGTGFVFDLKEVFLSKTLEDAIPLRRTVLRSFINPNKDDNYRANKV